MNIISSIIGGVVRLTVSTVVSTVEGVKTGAQEAQEAVKAASNHKCQCGTWFPKEGKHCPSCGALAPTNTEPVKLLCTCGAELKADYKFCLQCGKERPASPVVGCAHCMAILQDGARFCPSCGAPVAGPGNRVVVTTEEQETPASPTAN